MRTYDILLVALAPGGNRNICKWVRGIQANSLSAAEHIAIQANPHLGITPTQMSMGWYRFPETQYHGTTPTRSTH